MKLHSYSTTDAFDALESEWNNLLQRSITNTPFSSWQWHYHWWNAYCPGDLWIITIRNDDDLLVGIGSFFIANEDGKRVVHFIGCEDVTDYLDFLVDTDYQDEVYTAFVDALKQHSDKYDAIDLCNIPAESPTYGQFMQLLNNAGYDTDATRQEVCPVITLPDEFPKYIKSLDKKQSKELVRKIRIAQGQGDSVDWYIVDESHNLDEEIDKFLTLMAASHPEKEAFLEDEAHVRFFKSIVPAAYEAGWLQLNFLNVVGEPVATYLNFDYNNKILVYNSGLDPVKASQLSPGIVLLAYNIQHAIENGKDTFNFLRGDEEYKYRMGGKDTEIFNVKASLAT